MLIDSHCHLDRLNFDHHGGGLDQLLNAARERGVSAFLSVAVDLESSKKLQILAAQHKDVYLSAGVHPLQNNLPPLPEIEELIQLGGHPKVVAIGETGLDNFYSSETYDWQRESFVRHIQAAKQLGKPLIVHTREAQQETLDLICNEGGEAAGVLHCFTESWDMAKAALDFGYYISFSGIVTFKNAVALREVVKKVPLDRILVETDSPWLAPVPYRGQQNEPQYVVEVAQCVADLQAISFEKLAAATTENFKNLFKIC
jgi:TatD DNase family protein